MHRECYLPDIIRTYNSKSRLQLMVCNYFQSLLNATWQVVLMHYNHLVMHKMLSNLILGSSTQWNKAKLI